MKVNPDIQFLNDPDYLKLSKSITQPEPDKTAATAITGATSILNNFTTAADTVFKDYLKNKVEDQVTPERDAYTQGLEQKLAISKVNALGAGGTSSTDTTDTTESLTEDNEGGGGGDVPKEISKGIDSINSVSSARANGKMSQTYYIQRLNTIAKGLRSQFPGYRDYIDQQISTITGIHPANAYVKSLIGDINSYTTANNPQKEIDRDVAYGRSIMKEYNIPNLPLVIEQRRQGAISQVQFNSFVYPAMAQQSQFKAEKASLGNIKDNREAIGISATDVFTNRANSVGQQSLAALTIGMDNTKLTDFIQRAAAKPGSVDPENALQAGQVLAGSITQSYSVLKQEANTPIPEAGNKSLIQLIGPQEVEKRIQDGLAGNKMVLQLIHDKDFGLAGEMARINTAVGSKSLNILLNDPSVGPLVRVMKAGNDAGGPQFAQVLYTNPAIAALGKPDQESMKVMAAKLVSPTNITDPKFTMDKAFKLGRQLQEENQLQTPKQFYKTLIDFNKYLTDPTLKTPDKVKVDLADKVFSPENRLFLDNFNIDSVDDKGRPVPGKYSVFHSWTRPEVTKEIFRLGETNPELKKNYLDWASINYQTLFKKDLADLKDIQHQPNVNVSWDTKNHVWDIKTGPSLNQPYMGSERDTKLFPQTPDIQSINEAKRTVNRINFGLQSMIGIAKESNFDESHVDAYLLELMKQSGLNLTSNNPNIADMLGRALVTSRTKQLLKPSDNQ